MGLSEQPGLWEGVPAYGGEGLEWDVFNVTSNPNHSMILLSQSKQQCQSRTTAPPKVPLALCRSHICPQRQTPSWSLWWKHFHRRLGSQLNSHANVNWNLFIFSVTVFEWLFPVASFSKCQQTTPRWSKCPFCWINALFHQVNADSLCAKTTTFGIVIFRIQLEGT